MKIDFPVMAAVHDVKILSEEQRVEPVFVDIRFNNSTDQSSSVITRVNLGIDSRATVIIRYEAESDVSGFFQTVLELNLEAGAYLTLCIVSSLPEQCRREHLTQVKLERSSVLHWSEAIFDAGTGLYQADIDLNGQNAKLDFAGAYGAAGNTTREHCLNEIHASLGAKSRAILKSTLGESAHLIFRGLIHVLPGADGTDAYLSNRNLILDDGARAESLPQLRIETNDVACSHGSTTGGPREDELFYLMSRGLDRKSARNLLALGHLGEVLDRLPQEQALEMELVATRLLGEELL